MRKKEEVKELGNEIISKTLERKESEKISNSRKRGISLIALVITIIVVIILAAVAFGTSTDTIEQANYSNFTNNVVEVASAFHEESITKKGKEAQKGTTRTDAQVYNYVAKGGSEDAHYLVISAIPAYTIIEKEAEIGIELPKMKVESGTGKLVAVTYATTKEGEIFVWPPYEHEGEYYITDTDKVATQMTTTIKVGEEIFEIRIDPEYGTLLPADENLGGNDSGNEGTGNEGVGEEGSSSEGTEGEETQKEKLEVPTVKNNVTSYEYTGSVITVELEGINLDKMNVSGNTKTEVGTYIIIISLKEPEKYEWSNETTGNIEISWEIIEPAVVSKTIKEMVAAGEIKVGDYIAYTPDTATYLTDASKTGYSSQSLTTAPNTKWRVLSIDENAGTIKITTQGIVNSGTYLQGVAGYTTGLSELHTICEKLYSNSEKRITAQSMTIEDINEACGYIPSISNQKYAYYTNESSVSGTIDGYTKVAHSTMLHLFSNNPWSNPRFYTYDEDGETMTATSEESGYAELTSSTEPIKVTSTYYAYNISSYNSTVSEILTTSDGWLASSCIDTYSTHVGFFVRYVYNSKVDAYRVSYSYDYVARTSKGLRPMCNLSSTLKINGQDESGAWILK